MLLHSGYTRRRAFAYNLATGAATLAGALAGYFALGVDAADAANGACARRGEPALRRGGRSHPEPASHPAPSETAQQLALIGVGIAIIADRARRCWSTEARVRGCAARSRALDSLIDALLRTRIGGNT